MIREGSIVTLHYTGKLLDGTVFDSSMGKQPLTFTIGSKQVIPGFEKPLLGMAVGDKKTFTVAKEDGYQYHEDLLHVAPRSAAPADMDIKEGMTLALRAPNGQVVPAKVIGLDDEMITLDLNSPLAGKELTFDVVIVKIE